jgi:hypothetical protein
MRNNSGRPGPGSDRSGKKLLFLSCAVVAVALLTGITGCSGGDAGGQEDGVASVTESGGGGQGGATRSPAADASESGRPQIRLDSTDAEELRMYQGYLRCLKDRGVDIAPAGDKFADWADPGSLGYPGEDVAKEHPEVERACLGKKPMQPPELDPKKNPDYMNDYHEWIECNNRRGVKVDPLPDGSGWNYKPGANPPGNADQIDQECMREAFSGE